MGATGIAAGGALLALAGCSSSKGSGSSGGTGGSAAASTEVVYAGFGGTYDSNVKKYMYDPFTSQTHIKVVMTTNAPDPIAPIQAQVKSGHPQWDYMILNSATLAEAIRLDLCDAVDYSKLPNSTGYTSDTFKNKSGAGMWVFSSNLFWNTKAVKGTPQNWADVWDTKRFPGKRGFLSTDPQKTLTVALLADGVAIKDLYPLDLDRAFTSLDKIKSQSVFLDINTLTNQIAQQDIVMGMQNITRIKLAATDGIPLAYNWNQYLADTSFYSPLKGAKHLDAYYKLTNFVLSPPMQQLQPKDFGYTPSTKDGLSTIPLSTQKDLPASTVTQDQAVFASVDEWATQGVEATTKFTTWLSS
jgi:putative spermidine/putrescine transport system substrate-binding protein